MNDIRKCVNHYEVWVPAMSIIRIVAIISLICSRSSHCMRLKGRICQLLFLILFSLILHNVKVYQSVERADCSYSNELHSKHTILLSRCGYTNALVLNSFHFSFSLQNECTLNMQILLATKDKQVDVVIPLTEKLYQFLCQL